MNTFQNLKEPQFSKQTQIKNEPKFPMKLELKMKSKF